MAEEGGKPEKNYNPSNKWEYYDVSGEKVERKRRSCPKCGDGVFLAEHKDRVACGKCGYTEFARSTEKDEKPAEGGIEKKDGEEGKDADKKTEPEGDSSEDKAPTQEKPHE